MNTNTPISPIAAACNQVTVAIDALAAAINDKVAELAQMRAEMSRLKEKPLEGLLQLIADVCEVTPDEVIGDSRAVKFVIPRQVFCYVANKHYDIHPVRIGEIINKDRSTVIYSIGAVSNLLEVGDPQTTRIIDQILNLK